MQRFSLLLPIFFIIVFTTSCVKITDIEVMGLVPVYTSPDDFSVIRSEEPREFNNLGNIVNVGNFIFIGERNKGIHVLDNSIPSSPVNIVFWSIPGNNEFTIDGNTLYADNSVHLLVIDISDFGDIKYIKHFEDFYVPDESSPIRPPSDYTGPFVCYEISKGIVIDWEMELITNPNCEAY